jgi:DNA-binding response OmpR family regulator
MRALIVEDDLRITGLLREGLEEEGYQVLIASDGPTGLDIGRTGQFDVIILVDLMLPRLVPMRSRKRCAVMGSGLPS